MTDFGLPHQVSVSLGAIVGQCNGCHYARPSLELRVVKERTFSVEMLCGSCFALRMSLLTAQGVTYLNWTSR